MSRDDYTKRAEEGSEADNSDETRTSFSADHLYADETKTVGDSDDLSITLRSRGVTVALDEPVPDRGAITQPPRPAAPQPPNRPAASSSPPAKRPPALPVAPGDGKPFHLRHRNWLIAVLAVICILLLVVIYMMVKSFSRSESEKIASSANSIISPLNQDVEDSQKLKEFRGAAKSAKGARRQLADLQRRANRIRSDRERAAIVALLDAQTALLNSYAGMADLRRNNLKPVENLTSQADGAARDIRSAIGQMSAAGSSAYVDGAAVESAVANMSDELIRDQKLMARWTRKRNSQLRKQERFNSQADSLSTISNKFVDQRNAVGRFYNAPGEEIYSSGDEQIEGFKNARASLASRARSAASGEPLLWGARGALAHALDMSVRAFPKLMKAWRYQSSDETVAESSYFPSYDRATDAVDRNWNIFRSKLQAARSAAARNYRVPTRPRI